MKNPIARLAAALLIAVSLTGCAAFQAGVDAAKTVMGGGTDAPSAPAAATSSAAPTADPQEVLEAKETEKFNAYVDLNNFMIDRMNTVVESYFSRVAYQEEFEMLDTDDFWCNSLSESNRKLLQTAVDLAGEQPSFGALDEAVLALQPSMDLLMDLFTQVYTYGEAKGYLDDEYEKAAQLHAQVYETYNQYADLADAFMAQLNVLSDERTQEDLVQLKESGALARHSAISFLLAAQAIQQEMVDQEIDSTNLLDLDMEKIQPLYDALLTQMENCNTYMKDAEQLAEEGLTDTYYVESYLDTMIEVKASVSEMLQRVKEKDPPSDIDITVASSGTVESFYEELSDLIDAYNQMN